MNRYVESFYTATITWATDTILPCLSCSKVNVIKANSFQVRYNNF